MRDLVKTCRDSNAGLNRVARGQREFVRLDAARALQRFETRGDCSSPRSNPPWFRTRDEATSGSGESHAGSRRRRGDCSRAGQGPPAFLRVGGAHHRPPFPNQEGVEGRLPRHGDRRLGPHSSASPAGQRQKPGCAWLRGVPCSAAFCTLVCCKSARLLEPRPTNPLPSTNKSLFLTLLEL